MNQGKNSVKADIKLRQKNRIWGLFFIILLLLPGNILANNFKLSDLTNKMAEISSLRDLKEEIKGEKRKLRITSCQEAIRNPRVDYNIKLIQKILVYISGLNEKVQYLDIANEELAFLYQQAEDDLKILETLSDIKIEKLMGHINQATHKYQSEAKGLSIDVNGIVLSPPEEIWNSIIISSQ